MIKITQATKADIAKAKGAAQFCIVAVAHDHSKCNYLEEIRTIDYDKNQPKRIMFNFICK